MKNFIMILSAIALVCVGALVYIAMYLTRTQEQEKAMRQTEAARAARWKKDSEIKTEQQNESTEMVSNNI